MKSELLSSFFVVFIVFSPAVVICEEDFYEVLGVNRNASDKEIKSAYKKLAIKYHPDKNKEDTTKEFQKVSEAYEALKDEKSRKEYDMKRQGDVFGGFHGGQPFEHDNFFRTFEEFVHPSFHPNKDNNEGHRHNNMNFDFFQDNMMFDMFDDERFGSGSSFFGNHFGQEKREHEHSSSQRSGARSCRTVTQRIGNTVTTYTECF
ncbi:dnaJ homolog subfamily B member 9 isoform X2 [Nilaparvata lugens]|nr:dnaJ homolog subfamily B member 9 isoform X2 [Nilaparvata lugens]XP_039298658.1 dnaJ homolog subfamily B member 9 isoform X2 [Nilaparvata lugens]WJX09112.1 putative salivary protein [Nilaparvata lugens]